MEGLTGKQHVYGSEMLTLRVCFGTCAAFGVTSAREYLREVAPTHLNTNLSLMVG